MNDSSQGNAASQESLAEHPSDRNAEAEKRRQYVAANRDQIREMNRLWRADHLERARQNNRDSVRRAAARRHREPEVHPDRRREYQQRWVEENRAKVREYYNRYYETHRDEMNARAAARRDADPDRTKRISKEWADRKKERRAELQRTRRSAPDTSQSELGVNAAARRLKRRLSREGLPPKQLHPTTAAERRVNGRSSEAYFNDLSQPEHLRHFTVFDESLTEHMLKNVARMREFAEAYVENRARIGLPTVPVENIVYARAVELVVEWMRRVDLLTSRDVAAAVRSTKAEVRRAERQQQFNRHVKIAMARVQRNSARYVVDAEIENRARAH